MLVIDDKSVYEIDEECIKNRKVPKECGVCEKVLKKLQKDDHTAAGSPDKPVRLP